jgi:hypothetical protein
VLSLFCNEDYLTSLTAFVCVVSVRGIRESKNSARMVELVENKFDWF